MKLILKLCASIVAMDFIFIFAPAFLLQRFGDDKMSMDLVSFGLWVLAVILLVVVVIAIYFLWKGA